MTHVFIADLHLSPYKPELSRLFQDFIAKHSGPEFTLYILGDFFDIWLGDDYSMQFYQSDIAALQACRQHGSKIYLMHGNRDFLVGQAFAESTGITLLKDPTLIKLHDQTTLLTHGDQLCTDDIEYQAFRTQIQNETWINDFLSKPVDERLKIAEHFRTESKRLSQEKSDAIMDTNQHAIETLMAQHQATQLIHGHTHRPKQHSFDDNGQTITRWVVGDWHADHAQILVSSEKTLTLTTFKSE